jgi:hypothetical protein
MNTRRIVTYIPVCDGDILDLPRTAMPGVGRRSNSAAPGTTTIGAPATPPWAGRRALPAEIVNGDHIILGYQPAPLNPRARKSYEPSGWLIVLVDDSVKARPTKLRRNSRTTS